MADVEIERKRVTLHPLDENGVVDTTVNLYPKTFKDGIVDRDGNPVNVLTDADIGHIQEEIEELSTDKQDVLVSRKNIKSINNQDILGEGNLEVGGKEPLVVDDITALTSEQIASLDIGDEIIENTSGTTKRLYIVSFSPDVISDDKYLVSVTDERIFVVEYCNGEYDSSYEVPLYALSIGLYADEGKVLTANGNGGLEWKEPETKLEINDIENLSDEQCNALNVGDIVIDNSTREFIVSSKKITSDKKPYGILKLNSVNGDTITSVMYKKSNSSSPWGHDTTYDYNLNTGFNHRYNSQVDIDSLNPDFVNKLEIGDVVVCIPDFKNYTVTYKEGVDLYLNYTDSDVITDVYYSDGGYVDTFNVPVNILLQGLSANVGDVLTNVGPDELGWQSINTGEPEKITWSDLKAKRDNSQLVVGKKYRITDYTNSIVNTDSTSATNYIQFDIIVTAIKTNQLSESASACLKENDANNLSIDYDKWQLKYCLDNNVDRFEWANGKSITSNYVSYVRYSAGDSKYGTHKICWRYLNVYRWTDTSNPSVGNMAYTSDTGNTGYAITSLTVDGYGKGVIYWMKDEWGNEAPYDFKNTLFYYNDTRQGIGWNHIFTFCEQYIYNGNAYKYEISVKGKCKDCVIKEYLEENSGLYKIPFRNLFYSTVKTSDYKNVFTFKNNIIGYCCHENTILNNVGSLTIEGNKLDDKCYNNYIESNNNILGEYCHNIKITYDEEYLGSNVFGAFCNNIKSAEPQNVGDIPGFCYNKFEEGCSNITLPSLNNHNTFGKYCSFISTNYTTKLFMSKIGDNCSNINFAITPVDGCIWLHNFEIDRNCKFINIKGLNESEYDTGDIDINNSIHLHSDIQGTSQSYKEIEINLELDHPVDYYANNQEDIII